MKKSLIVLSAIVACAFVLFSCENGGGKPSEKSTLSGLPGTWKVTQVVDEKGQKTDFEGDVVFIFGKQESMSDYGSNHSSSLWGYCDITVSGDKVVNRGTWNIEPSPEDKGVLFYCMSGRGSSFVSVLGDEFFYITSLSSKSMRWEIGDDASGYILERVE